MTHKRESNYGSMYTRSLEINENAPLLFRKCDNVDVSYGLMHNITSPTTAKVLGMLYATCVAMFTVVEVVIFLNIPEFSEMVGILKTTLQSRTYLYFSAAALAATFTVPWCLACIYAQWLLLFLTVLSFTLVLLLKYVTQAVAYYAAIIALGACIGVGNTVCVTMTRKLHRQHAGFWISLNGIMFTLFNASGIMIEQSNSKATMMHQLTAVASMLCFTFAFIMITPSVVEIRMNNTDDDSDDDSNCCSLEAEAPHYRVECIALVVMFMLIGNELILGGNCQTSDLLNRYIEETGVIATSREPALAVLYFVSILLSRIGGALYQINASTSDLMLKTQILLFLTAVTAIAVLLFPSNEYVFVVGTVLIGLFYGTIPPFVVQIINRSTFPTAMSTSIFMIGVNAGVIIMPMTVAVLWDDTPLGKYTIWILLACCHALCMPLLASLKSIRYFYQD